MQLLVIKYSRRLDYGPFCLPTMFFEFLNQQFSIITDAQLHTGPLLLYGTGPVEGLGTGKGKKTVLGAFDEF